MSLEAIHANAQLVIEHCRALSGLENQFGFNRESLQWVEGYIERMRDSQEVSPQSYSKLVQVFGSFLGECVIHTYGGAWKEKEGQWGVFFDDLNAVFPFSKTRKLFENGRAGGDSIVGLLDMIPPVFKRK